MKEKIIQLTERIEIRVIPCTRIFYNDFDQTLVYLFQSTLEKEDAEIWDSDHLELMASVEDSNYGNVAAGDKHVCALLDEPLCGRS